MGRVRAVRRGASWRIALAATEAPVGAEALLPPERELVEGATAGAAGRVRRRAALRPARPGVARPGPVRDAGAPRRAAAHPLWPPGVVGSVTHCAGWTGAVVARSRGSRFGRGVTAIGLDAEPIAPLPAGVVEVVASVEEREALARLGAERPGIPWDTLLFCAKEATYKAWYPLTGIVLSHAEVEVELSPTGAFTGRAAAYDAAGREVVHRVRGRWGLGPRVLVTLGVVP